MHRTTTIDVDEPAPTSDCLSPDIRYLTDNGMPGVPADDEERCAVNHLVVERRVNRAGVDGFVDGGRGTPNHGPGAPNQDPGEYPSPPTP